MTVHRCDNCDGVDPVTCINYVPNDLKYDVGWVNASHMYVVPAAEGEGAAFDGVTYDIPAALVEDFYRKTDALSAAREEIVSHLAATGQAQPRRSMRRG